MIFFKKQEKKFLFKKKITIVQNFVGRRTVEGKKIYKSLPTPSRFPVHVAEVCHLILVMKVNN
jgi:hypothetical protein